MVFMGLSFPSTEAARRSIARSTGAELLVNRGARRWARATAFGHDGRALARVRGVPAAAEPRANLGARRDGARAPSPRPPPSPSAASPAAAVPRRLLRRLRRRPAVAVLALRRAPCARAFHLLRQRRLPARREPPEPLPTAP